jgi:ribosomal protein S18 acetylase RimI-like enzyme
MAGWHLSEQAREALRTARDLARGRRAAGSPDPLLMLPMSAAGRLLRELGVGYEDVVRHIEAEGARRVAGEDWRPEEHPLEGWEEFRVTDQQHEVRPGSPPGARPSPRPRVVSVEVEAVHEVTDELVDAAGRLLPQLSSSAMPIGADALERVVGHEATTLFVARSHGHIVGMLILVTFPLLSGVWARIEDVVVDRDARGQGVGTALTMAALELAEAQGARSVDLTSRASRVAANRLYLRLGFQLRDSNVYRYQSRSGDE